MNADLIVAIAAIITALSGLLGSILSHRKLTALMEYRLGEVEKRLDSHNHYAEKFADSAVAIAQIQKDIEYLRGKNE